MKAVNLIPTDARRGGSSIAAQAPTYAILGLLAIALAFVTVDVLTSNSIADRTAKLSSLQTRIAQTQAQASNLVDYTQFAQLVQQRSQTVMTIATGRFDWHAPLIDLSEVVPANTSLQSLQAGLGSGSAASGASMSTSASGSAGGALLGSTSGPAIELTGCTGSQDDVARLMSRLRLIAGATRVTLGNSQKSGTGGASTASGTQGAAGCGSNAPTFDLVVALTPQSGSSTTGPAAATGAAAGASSTPSSTTTTTTSPTTTTRGSS